MTTSSPPLLEGSREPEAAEPTRSWSGREHAKRYRGVIVLALGALLVVVLTLVIRSYGTPNGLMDPQSYDPYGGRALATLLNQRGVPVSRLTSVDQVMATAKAGSTVVVADPINEQDLSPLRRLPASVTVVLIAPDEDSLASVQPGLIALDDLDVKAKNLDCKQQDAVLAGAALTGGSSYARRPSDPVRGQFCYDATLYVQAADGRAGFVDIGSAETLSNADLGKEGNAALGLGLLGHGTNVLWLVPGPVHLQPTTTGRTPISQLLPARLGWAVLQLLIAVGLLMLWRARRLGRVVWEPLPVVVRASETVEGQGRLYRAARSRGRAAQALRGAAASRLARRLGVGRDDDLVAVVTAVAARTTRNPQDVAALLYGAEPEDDQGLVALADQLDALEAEVRRT